MLSISKLNKKVIKAYLSKKKLRRGLRLSPTLRTFGVVVISVIYFSIPSAVAPAPASASSTPVINIARAPGVVTLGGSTSFTVTVLNGFQNLEIYETLYPKIISRTALLSLKPQSTPPSYPIAISAPTALNIVNSSSPTSFTIPLSIGSSPSSSLNLSSCGTSCSGNYPLQIRLANSQTGAVYSEITIPMTVVSGSATKALGVSFVLSYQTPSFSPKVFHSLISFLTTHSTLAMAVDIAPSLLADAENSRLIQVHQDLLQLLHWSLSKGHDVVATTYVPVDPTCLSYLKGPGSYNTQINSGLRVVAPFSPSNRIKTFLASPFNSAETLATPMKMGYSQVLVPGSYLSTLGFTTTLTAPVRVAGLPASMIGIDHTLSQEFSNTSGSLSRLWAVADLSQIYFDAPNDPRLRVVAIDVSISNSSQASSFATALKRVLLNPLLDPLNIEQAFSVPSVKSVPLQRLSLSSPTSKGCVKTLRDQFVKAEQDVQTLMSLSTKISQADTLNSYLLSAEAYYLTEDETKNILRQVTVLASKDLSSIGVVANSNFTLTARKTTIPITVTSKFKVPVSIVLELKSLKLQFPSGNKRDITLTRPIATVSFPVAVKTLGSFPLQIVVKAPNGSVITTSEIGVRSEAFSIVGVILTAGSLGVFLLWWAKSILRTRRKRRVARTNK